MDDVPHIALPMRVAGGAFVTVQQDTTDEVVCTVAAIASFPIGWRDEAPEFGVTPMEFGLQPLDTTELQYACEMYEPRARVRVVSVATDDDPTAAREQIEVTMFAGEE